MRVLVIYAHPLADSFAAALHQAIVAALRRSGHEVDDCDLYAEGFDPVLSAAERRTYNSPSPDLSGVAEHVAQLSAAEALVLCFPTWWYGMRAILKGYFDRVWAKDVAFHLPEGGGRDPPRAVKHQEALGSDQLRRTVVADPSGAARSGPRGHPRRPRPTLRARRRDPVPRVL